MQKQNHNGAPVALKDRATNFAALIQKQKTSYAQVLPRGMSVDRFARVTVAALVKNPDLLQCTEESVLLSVSEAARLGLEPTGTLGSAYLVPYRTKQRDGSYRMVCQLIVGYRGLIDLARRSGQIETIEAHVVRQGDTFDVAFGLDPKLVHVPDWENADGDLRFVYAIARLKGGAVQYEVMSRAQIDKVKAGSKAGKYGPWVDHYEEMARKTVIRRLAKYLPLSVEDGLTRAIELEDEAERGGPVIDVSATVEEIAASVEADRSPVEAVTARLEAKRNGRRKKAIETVEVKAEAEPELDGPPDFGDSDDPGFDPDAVHF